MTFETIYSNRQKFFPIEIDISDGKNFDNDDGFVSDNLSLLWNNAEERISCQAEGNFVWSSFRVIHRIAKQKYNDGHTILLTESISKDELYDEYKIVLQEAETISKKNFCCNMMTTQINFNCVVHDSKYDCPDYLIDFNEKYKTFRLIIHDGGSSGIEIQYCPWCGQKL